MTNKQNESIEFVQRGGGGVKPQIQTFLVFILVVLQSKSGDGLGRQKVLTKSILSFFGG